MVGYLLTVSHPIAPLCPDSKRISSETVLRVLADEETRNLLETFLTKEFAEESYIFWAEVETFKKLTDSDEVKKEAKRLFLKFVKQVRSG